MDERAMDLAHVVEMEKAEVRPRAAKWSAKFHLWFRIGPTGVAGLPLSG